MPTVLGDTFMSLYRRRLRRKYRFLRLVRVGVAYKRATRSRPRTQVRVRRFLVSPSTPSRRSRRTLVRGYLRPSQSQKPQVSRYTPRSPRADPSFPPPQLYSLKDLRLSPRVRACVKRRIKRQMIFSTGNAGRNGKINYTLRTSSNYSCRS